MGESSMDLTDIDYLGIDRVLKRGTGKVIERHDAALLVHDSISGACMLGCEDAALGANILRYRRGGDCRLLMVVSDHGLGLKAFAQYGFESMLECYQTAY